MIREALLAELKYEADNTRRLFNAVPDDILQYQPTDFNWTTAELAAHIAQIYHWWDATLNLDVLEMSTYSYDPGNISSMDSIKQKLEENIAEALENLQQYPEDKLTEMWTMQNQGVDLMPPMPRIQVIRSFLMNHVYHHRGELVAYLRANGRTVPGLYGPSYEEQQAINSGAS